MSYTKQLENRHQIEKLKYENEELLNTLLKNKPHSMNEFINLTNKVKSNLSITLKTLQEYGIIQSNKKTYY